MRRLGPPVAVRRSRSARSSPSRRAPSRRRLERACGWLQRTEGSHAADDRAVGQLLGRDFRRGPRRCHMVLGQRDHDVRLFTDDDSRGHGRSDAHAQAVAAGGPGDQVEAGLRDVRVRDRPPNGRDVAADRLEPTVDSRAEACRCFRFERPAPDTRFDGGKTEEENESAIEVIPVVHVLAKTHHNGSRHRLTDEPAQHQIGGVSRQPSEVNSSATTTPPPGVAGESFHGSAPAEARFHISPPASSTPTTALRATTLRVQRCSIKSQYWPVCRRRVNPTSREGIRRTLLKGYASGTRRFLADQVVQQHPSDSEPLHEYLENDDGIGTGQQQVFGREAGQRQHHDRDPAAEPAPREHGYDTGRVAAADDHCGDGDGDRGQAAPPVRWRWSRGP